VCFLNVCLCVGIRIYMIVCVSMYVFVFMHIGVFNRACVRVRLGECVHLKDIEDNHPIYALPPLPARLLPSRPAVLNFICVVSHGDRVIRSSGPGSTAASKETAPLSGSAAAPGG